MPNKKIAPGQEGFKHQYYYLQRIKRADGSTSKIRYLAEAGKDKCGHRLIEVRFPCDHTAKVRLDHILSGQTKGYGGIRRQEQPGFIRLAKGELVKVSLEDWDYLAQFNWFLNKNGYAIREKLVNGKQTNIYMHRVILEHQGFDLTDLVGKRSNRDKLDNRRENLRPATKF